MCGQGWTRASAPAWSGTPAGSVMGSTPVALGAGVPGVPEQSFFDDGYALVGVIDHGTGDCNGEATWLFIGDR